MHSHQQCVGNHYGNIASLYSCWHCISIFKVFPNQIEKNVNSFFWFQYAVPRSVVKWTFFSCVYSLYRFLLQISFVHFSVCYLLLICWDYLYSVLCPLTLWPYMLKTFSTFLLPFFFGVFIYTEDFILPVVKSVVFPFLVSEFCALLRRGEPFIVCKALSFPFSHRSLDHTGLVKCKLSSL